MNCRVFMAHSTEEAWRLCTDYPGAAFVAGGTDLLPRVNQKIEWYPALIGLEAIEGLSGVAEEEEYLRIGALTKLVELTQAPLLADYTALREAAGRAASPQIRNRGTLGGNLLQENRCGYFNQSVSWRRIDNCFKLGGDRCYQYKNSPCCVAQMQSDLAPVLIAHDARLVFAGPHGQRELLLRDLYLPAGVKAKEAGEILTEILLPKPHGTWRSAYARETIRGSFDFPLISCATLVERNGDRIKRAALVLGSAGWTPQVVEEMTALQGLTLREMASRQAELIAAGRKKIMPFRNTGVDIPARKAMGEAVMERVLAQIIEI